jgi:hypothetical protein
VVEPPIAKGVARVKMVKRTGTKLLTPDQALQRAQRIIKESRLGEQSKYEILNHKDVQAARPLLVRDEPAGTRTKSVPQYYIVPFGLKGQTGERDERQVRVCVLVNAYTGDLEEVTAFGRPIRYLTEQESLEVVARALHVEPSAMKDAQATLMFQAGDITHVRTYPFWRVVFGKRTLYVDQLGKLYGKLLPAVPGD